MMLPGLNNAANASTHTLGEALQNVYMHDIHGV